MRTYTCHAPTLPELMKHINCCEVHYSVRVDTTKIKKPMPPAVSEWRVDSGIPYGTRNRCPKTNKGCIRSNNEIS